MPLDRNHFRRSRDAPTLWIGCFHSSSRSREVNPTNLLDAVERVETQAAPKTQTHAIIPFLSLRRSLPGTEHDNGAVQAVVKVFKTCLGHVAF